MAKRDYIQTNREWLAAKATDNGVQPLPKGLYYKVLNQGKNDGIHPTPNSIVTVHYTGTTINGKKFDSSLGGAPVAFRLKTLIPGWIEAIQHMCVGDKWEVYIPAEMGYGRQSIPGIPGGSTISPLPQFIIFFAKMLDFGQISVIILYCSNTLTQ